MGEINQNLVFCFVHAHCRRLVELLEPDVEFGEYGTKLDGHSEAEVMGHLRTLSLLSKKLDEYFESLVQGSGEKTQ